MQAAVTLPDHQEPLTLTLHPLTARVKLSPVVAYNAECIKGLDFTDVTF